MVGVEAIGSFLSGIVAGGGAAYAFMHFAVVKPLKSEVKEAHEMAERADDRAEQHRFVLFGDPDDPNQQGLADKVDRMDEKIDRLLEKHE